MPEETVKVADVQVSETRTGTKRWVVKADDGREFTTFRERIGADAEGARGRRARVKFHEQQKGQYTNVYLDEIEPLADGGGAEDDTDPEEAGWRTAVDAAPWLVGDSSKTDEVPPDEMFDKLKPFKDRVAEDIREEPD